MAMTEYLFLAAPVPETSEYLMPGVGGAGNLAVRGIAEGLYSVSKNLTVLGFLGVRSFPKAKIFYVGGKTVTFRSGLNVRLLPFLNIPVVRNVWRNLVFASVILIWCLRHRNVSRVIVTYNYSFPPIWLVAILAKLTNSLVVPILFDVGSPLTSSGVMNDLMIKWREVISEKVLSRLSAGCVIVSKIQSVFMPKAHALLLDGGVSPEIKQRMFDLKRKNEQSADGIVTFVLAGSISDYNGIDLLLKAMEINTNDKIRLMIAGGASASDVRKIKEAEDNDQRIRYLGRLSLDELFGLYEEMDVFLNLRITKAIDTSFYFPSKLIESLAVGRYVLSTNVAHMKKVYGEYCRILEVESPEALSIALDEVASIPRAVRDQLGAKARCYMLNEHSWERQMQRFHKYCELVCAGALTGRVGIISEI